ncbi:acyltransferase family protein [Kitasatospora kifunensis]|uniref:Peptidoglycan/LPS O-acetylase OafA/YrhL/lysophospholipase L1-like esterase n=1 Tax=Kitasatospora kifunensis TaxID=58351 RepID=A0A7W7VUS4_KITKI|nr:acyltransferase family protein [Kitasatospora kifunensis]MBB4923637.1 peptidoglycan/LPS O-acetylase OafA/YrhL/lysophospholipase L1-like esterase [Kitasatospora kifunensis]
MREAREASVAAGRLPPRPDVSFKVADPVPVPAPRTAERSGRTPSFRYAAVDGLRGIAIISVLLYHTNWFENGLFGVDAFFVLSGFLVTLILIRELDRSGRIALGRFYRRRAKRLLPGLLLTLVAVLALAATFSSLRDAQALKPQALATLLQYANWAQIANGSAYWEHFASITPLAAMWSLSITEQFYLVWPLLLGLLFVLLRRSMRATAVAAFVLFGAAAAVAPLLWNGSNSDRLYLGTESRAVGFAAGAVAAFVVHLLVKRSADKARSSGRTAEADGAQGRSGRRRRAAEPAAPASGGLGTTVLLNLLGTGALASVVWLSLKVTTYHSAWLYQGGLAVVATLVAVLAATLCHPRGPLVRILSFGPLVQTGRISYSLYLLHLPVYWMMQQHIDDVSPALLFGVGGSITWVLAFFLHHGTEALRRRDWRVSRAVPLLTATALAVGAASWYLPSFIEYRMRPAGKPLVVSLGDSFAGDLATGLYQQGGRFAVVDGSVSGCGVFDPEKVRGTSQVEFDTTADCQQRSAYWTKQLHVAKPQAVLIHLGWDAAEQYLDGGWLSPCDAAYQSRYRTQLTSAIDQVKQQAPGARILLMNERLENGAINRKWGTCYDQQIDGFVKAAAGSVQLVDLNDFLCPQGACRWEDDKGNSIYPTGDGVHLTPAGMRLVTPWLQDQISAALAAPQH